ncbi:DUF3618 domain-containing protein [Haloechinothrix halophila]|uniref:DUF3618 domain-containing protein n=1 Tax=Haloechinothrix halophila TaxID=1069073 RepID=UPI0004071F00|nr:DUF3618 domain-containing protein [Haloechinothrix halophila]
MTEIPRRTDHLPERESDQRTEEKTMPGSTPTVADLRQDVELTREELADTVSELARKLDVKTRTSESMRRQVASAQRHPAVVGASTLGLLGLIATLIVVKRLRNR